MLTAAFLSEAVYRVSELHQQPEALERSIHSIDAAYSKAELQVQAVQAPRATGKHRFIIAHSRSTLYVSFLGTKHLRDLLADLRVWQEPLDLPHAAAGSPTAASTGSSQQHSQTSTGSFPASSSTGQRWASQQKPAAHSGFLARARSVAQAVQELYEQARREGRSLVLCGHSLGAAVAILASLQLLSDNPGAAGVVRCVGFAAPAVGNAALAAHVAQRGWQGLFELHSTPEDKIIGMINRVLVRGRARAAVVVAHGQQHAQRAVRSVAGSRAVHNAGHRQLLGLGCESTAGLPLGGLLASLPSPRQPWQHALASSYGRASSKSQGSAAKVAKDLASIATPLVVPQQAAARAAAAAAKTAQCSPRRQLPGLLLLWQVLVAMRSMSGKASRTLSGLAHSLLPQYHDFGVQFHVTSRGLMQVGHWAGEGSAGSSSSNTGAQHGDSDELQQHMYAAAGSSVQAGRQQRAAGKEYSSRAAAGRDGGHLVPPGRVGRLIGGAVRQGQGLAALLGQLHPGRLQQLYWSHRMLAYRARISQVAAAGRGEAVVRLACGCCM